MKIDYIFDFGSPNAYMVHKMLPTISRRTGADFHYIPCLLGGIFKETGNLPPWQAFANVPVKMEYERLEIQRFLIKNKLTEFSMNPHFPINTISLVRGACAMKIESDDKYLNYIDVIFKAMWEDKVNMNDPHEVSKVLTAAGYNASEFIELIQSPNIKEQLKANTTMAIERGVFGIPTLFVGDEMFFGKERLGQMEEEIMRQQA